MKIASSIIWGENRKCITNWHCLNIYRSCISQSRLKWNFWRNYQPMLQTGTKVCDCCSWYVHFKGFKSCFLKSMFWMDWIHSRLGFQRSETRYWGMSHAMRIHGSETVEKRGFRKVFEKLSSFGSHSSKFHMQCVIWHCLPRWSN